MLPLELLLSAKAEVFECWGRIDRKHCATVNRWPWWIRLLEGRRLVIRQGKNLIGTVCSLTGFMSTGILEDASCARIHLETVEVVTQLLSLLRGTSLPLRRILKPSWPQLRRKLPIRASIQRYPECPEDSPSGICTVQVVSNNERE